MDALQGGRLECGNWARVPMEPKRLGSDASSDALSRPMQPLKESVSALSIFLVAPARSTVTSGAVVEPFDCKD